MPGCDIIGVLKPGPWVYRGAASCAAFFVPFDGRVYFYVGAGLRVAANGSLDVGSHWEMQPLPNPIAGDGCRDIFGRPGRVTISSPLDRLGRLVFPGA